MKKLIVLVSLSFSISAMAANYSCGGTEPFWDLTIEDNTIAYNSIFDDSSATNEVIISKTDAKGMVSDFAFVIKTPNATATIITGACSDGMSETVYDKHIMYSTADSVIYGCCNKIR